MSKPLVVTIPHRLGRDEALRRLKSGLRSAQEKFGQFFTLQEETWIDNRLQFRVTALAQKKGLQPPHPGQVQYVEAPEGPAR